MDLSRVLSRLPVKGVVTASSGASSAGYLPILNASGVLDPSFTQSLTLSHTYIVSDNSARNALTGLNVGDLVKVTGSGTSSNKVWALASGTGNNDGDWIQIGDTDSTAASMAFTPVGSIVATDVQAAIAAVEANKATIANLTAHTANVSNPHSVTKTQIGLSNVTNDAQVKRVELAAANGVATLDGSGIILSAQLPTTITKQGNTFNSANQLIQLNSLGKIPTLNASNLTNINAGNISTGIVGVGRLPIFVGSGGGHAAGIVPDAGSIAGTSRYLREDGSWITPNFTGGSGTVTSVDFTGDNIVFETATGGPITTNGVLSLSLKSQTSKTFLAAPISVNSIPSFRTITIADLPETLTNQGNAFNGANQLLQLNGIGQLPAISGALLTGLTKAQVGLGNVSNTNTTNATNISSGILSVNRLTDFVGSGPSHARGVVPDPGATAGTVKFLREDGTWSIPVSDTTVPGLTSVDVLGDGVLLTSSTGGPLTTDGTLQIVLNTQLANKIFAGPSTGTNGLPTFRALVAADLPASVTKQGNSFNAANQLIKLDATAKIPALDASLLIGLSPTQVGLGEVPNVNATNADNITSGTIAIARLTDFIGSGSTHASGMVPDPGPVAGTNRYLREDGEWFAPSSYNVTINGVNGPTFTIDKFTVGLSNVDNTADLAKPISTSTQVALNNKLSAFASALQSGTDKVVYFAVRTDGVTGTGTVYDPINANTTTTFATALNNVLSGSIVICQPGNYRLAEQYTVTGKKIHLIGYSSKISGSTSSNWGGFVFGTGSDNSIIEGFEIDATTSGTAAPGVVANNSNLITVRNTYIHGAINSQAVLVSGVSNGVTIENSRLDGCTQGVYALDFGVGARITRITVRNCNITGLGGGAAQSAGVKLQTNSSFYEAGHRVIGCYIKDAGEIGVEFWGAVGGCSASDTTVINSSIGFSAGGSDLTTFSDCRARVCTAYGFEAAEPGRTIFNNCRTDGANSLGTAITTLGFSISSGATATLNDCHADGCTNAALNPSFAGTVTVNGGFFRTRGNNYTTMFQNCRVILNNPVIDADGTLKAMYFEAAGTDVSNCIINGVTIIGIPTETVAYFYTRNNHTWSGQLTNCRATQMNGGGFIQLDTSGGGAVTLTRYTGNTPHSSFGGPYGWSNRLDGEDGSAIQNLYGVTLGPYQSVRRNGANTGFEGYIPGNEVVQVVGDSNATIAANTTLVRRNATLTTTRTYTLPSAASYSAGNGFTYIAEVNSGSNSVFLRSGTDTLPGNNASLTISPAITRGYFTSDGVSGWKTTFPPDLASVTGNVFANGANNTVGQNTFFDLGYGGTGGTFNISDSTGISIFKATRLAVGFFNATPIARLTSPDIGSALTSFGLTAGTPTFNATNLTGTVADARLSSNIPRLNTYGSWTATQEFQQINVSSLSYLGSAVVDDLTSGGNVIVQGDLILDNGSANSHVVFGTGGTFSAVAAAPGTSVRRNSTGTDFVPFIAVERVDVPTTNSSLGSFGQFALDNSYAYFCVGTNTWRRSALAAW